MKLLLPLFLGGLLFFTACNSKSKLSDTVKINSSVVNTPNTATVNIQLEYNQAQRIESGFNPQVDANEVSTRGPYAPLFYSAVVRCNNKKNYSADSLELVHFQILNEQALVQRLNASTKAMPFDVNEKLSIMLDRRSDKRMVHFRLPAGITINQKLPAPLLKNSTPTSPRTSMIDIPNELFSVTMDCDSTQNADQCQLVLQYGAIVLDCSKKYNWEEYFSSPPFLVYAYQGDLSNWFTPIQRNIAAFVK